MAITVGEVNAKFGLDSSEFHNGMKLCQNNFNSFGNSMISKAATIGAAIAGSLAIGSALTSSIQAYAQYEQGLANVQKIVGSTTEETKQYGEQLKNLSVNTGIATTSLESLASSLSSAGVAKKDLMSSTEGTAIGAKALGLDPEAIATDFGKISNIYGVTGGEAKKFFSMVNELENSGVATGQQLLTGLAQMAPLYVTAGGSLQQYAGVMSTAVGLGLDTSQVFTELNSAMSQATQNEKNITEASKLLGVSQSDYIKMMKTDGINTVLNLNKAIEKQYNSVDGAIAKQRLFGVVGSKPIELLSKNYDQLTTNINSASTAWDQGTSVQEEFDRSVNTITGSYDKFAAGLNVVSTEFGAMQAGPVKSLFDYLNSVGIPTARDLIAAFNTGDFSKFESTINSLKEKILKGLQLGTEELGITAILAAFAMLSSGVIAQYTHIATIGIASWAKQKTGALSSIATMSKGVVLAFGKMATSSLKAVSSMGISILGVFSKTAASAVLSAGTMASTTIAHYSRMAITSATHTATMATTVLSHYAKMVIGAASSVASIVSTTVGGMLSIASTIAAPVALIVAGLAGIGLALDPSKFTTFNTIAVDAFNGIKDVVSDCWDCIENGDFSGVVNRLSSALTDAYNYALKIDWNSLGSELSTMISDGAKAVIDETLDIGGWIYDSLTDWLNSGKGSDLGYDIGNSLISGIESLFSTNGTNSIWDLIKKGLGVAEDWLKLGQDIAVSIGKGLYDAFKPYLDNVYNSILLSFAEAEVYLIGWKDEIVSLLSNTFTSVEEDIGYIVTKTKELIDILSTKFSLSEAWSEFVTYIGNIQRYFSAINLADLSQLIESFQGESDPSDPGSNINNPNTEKMSIKSVASGAFTNESIYYNKKNNVWRTGNELNSAGYKNTEDWKQVVAEFSTTEIKTSEASTTKITTAIGQTTQEVKTLEDTTKRQYEKYNPLTKTTETVQWTQNQINAWEAALKGLIVEVDNSREKEKTTTEAINAGNITNAQIVSKTVLDSYAFGTKQAWSVTDAYAALNPKIAAIGTQLEASTTQSTTTQKAASDYITGKYNQASQNAITMSAQVCGNFSTGGKAVEIGLTSTGQQIAIIGSVAKQQYLEAGNKLISDVGLAGSKFNNDGNAAGTFVSTGANSAKISMQEGGNFVSTSGKNFATDITNAGTTLSNGVIKLDASIANLLLGTTNYKVSGQSISTTGSTTTGSITSTANTVNANNANTVNANGADVNGNFQDVNCVGNTVLVNGLKYTNPQGQTTIINPLTYHDEGGIANYQAAGNTLTKSANTAASIQTTTASNVAKTQTTTANAINSQSTATANYNAFLTRMGLANYIQSQNAQNSANIASTNANNANIKSTVATASGDWISANNQATRWTTESTNSNAATTTTAANNLGNTLNNSNVQFIATNTKFGNTVTQIDALNKSIGTTTDTLVNSVTNAVNSISTTATNIIGLANRGGGTAWGGTSVSGGGAWIGTGSTAVNGKNYVTWGGTALSNYIKSTGSMSGYVSGNSFSWGAKGADISSPTALIAGEKGEELLLPSNISKMFIGIANKYSDNESIPQSVNIVNGVNSTIGNISSSSIREIKENLTLDVTLNIDGKKLVNIVMPLMATKLKTGGLKNY